MFQGFVGRQGNLCVVRGMNQEEIKQTFNDGKFRYG